jgi:uncharacterized protein YdaU (DUF1376 family)
MHFFSVFPDAWLTGTADLTIEESGVFWNICCHYMAKDGRVPDDDRILARVAKLSTRRWRAVKATLLDGNYLEVRSGFLWQEKCEERLQKDGNFARSQRDKARKKWAKKQAKLLNGQGSGLAPASPEAGASTATSSVAKATGGNPPLGSVGNTPPSDPVKALWDFGVSVLTSAGKTERDARAMIGKWRSRLRNDGKLIGLLITANNQSAVEPVAYISKAISNEDRPQAGIC